MKKIKTVIITVSLIAITAAASVASAASDTFDISMTVDAYSTISTCGSVAFSSTFTNDSGQISPACNITAYSNNSTGFYITLQGTNAGFHNPAIGTEWGKLQPTDDTIDTGCTSSCSEEWGWRIKNGTPAGYATGAVQTDSNNGSRVFDAATYWHTVNYESVGSPGMVGAEKIIDQSVASSEGANFDIEFGATTDSTDAGNYTDTITLTIIVY